VSDATLQVIECDGDPRAMGKAQGMVCRDAIASRLARAAIASRGRNPLSLRPFLAGPVLGSGMAREISRHYPHLGERIQGIARGAGRSADSMMELFIRAACGELSGEVLGAPAGVGARVEDTGCRLERAFGVSEANGSEWILRRSQPEVGFASVELTLPWLATSVVGVNEAGVAAAIGPLPLGGPAARPRAPSVLLLVQECLQRFHDLPGAVDWCLKRPVSGRAEIVLADETGSVASITIDGDQRRQGTADAPEFSTEGPHAMASPMDRSLRVRFGAHEPEQVLSATPQANPEDSSADSSD
jgi:hypothetical protein